MGYLYFIRQGNRSIYFGIVRDKMRIKIGSICTTFGLPVLTVCRVMKYSEFHRRVRKNGWRHIRTEGSHYIYAKNGRTYPVPFHGAKEIGEGLRKTITKEMGLK